MFFSFLRFPLVALVARPALVSSTSSVSALPSLTVGTSSSDPNIDGSGGLKVIATVVNTGGESLRLLNDPRGVLDPFPENTFTFVGPSDSRPSFRGARASYNSTLAAGVDDPNLFTVLAPGGSVDVTHDLSATYDFTRSGTGEYTVEPSNLFTYIDADGTPKDLYATVGDIAKVEVSVELGVSRHVHNKRELNFLRCSPSQEQKIAEAVGQAHRNIVDAHEFARIAMEEYEQGRLLRRYVHWFGLPPEVQHLRRVRDKLELMGLPTAFSDLTYICHTTARPRHGGLTTIAYFDSTNLRNMHFIPAFFERATTIQERTLMLIIQIASVRGLLHRTFNYEACLDMAASRPDHAISNTGNYGYFVMNTGNQ